MLKTYIIAGLCYIFPVCSVQASQLAAEEVVVNGGHFYVGTVFGDNDYAAHANITVSTFAITKTEITYQQYHALQEWAKAHNYQMNEGCNGAIYEDCLPPEKDHGQHPVTNVSWWDAVLFANALSEQQHLQPYYLTIDGQTLKSVSEDEDKAAIREAENASGYRLPSLAEWQIAARGGKKSLIDGTYGYRYAGSDRSDGVAHFPSDPPLFATVPVATKRPNALGLYDMSGNVSEWLNERFVIEGGKTMYYFCGGSYLARVSTLASCDLHTPGFIMSDIGFRLVRTLDEK